ncbi:hypothetical protein OS189_05655 [Sulfitobacter sp. F26169L]|uniref:hypothetical protein n=1 Tax=Sulfitobacter sp. F26169L TaxID=2996015 RepID=UPI002260D65D|nr:hypothetical protein [Sulfitobacter sp. F26169L]MCX7565821.1 hypothetical protein [Sulfitobacter sp. F26169L]
MSIIIKTDAFTTDKVMQIVTRERAVALSAREWKHRLAGYGYSIRDTDDGRHVLETLPHQVELCELPEELFN